MTGLPTTQNFHLSKLGWKECVQNLRVSVFSTGEHKQKGSYTTAKELLHVSLKVAGHRLAFAVALMQEFSAHSK